MVLSMGVSASNPVLVVANLSCRTASSCSARLSASCCSLAFSCSVARASCSSSWLCLSHSYLSLKSGYLSLNCGCLSLKCGCLSLKYGYLSLTCGYLSLKCGYAGPSMSMQTLPGHCQGIARAGAPLRTCYQIWHLLLGRIVVAEHVLWNRYYTTAVSQLAMWSQCHACCMIAPMTALLTGRRGVQAWWELYG